MAIPRWSGATSLIRLPSSLMSPSVTDSSPAIMRSSVDLPQPLGPTSTANCPSATSKLTPLMTSTAPKFLRTFSMDMLAIFSSLTLDPAGERAHQKAARQPECRHRRQHVQQCQRTQIAVVDGVRPLEGPKQSDRQQLQLGRRSERQWHQKISPRTDESQQARRTQAGQRQWHQNAMQALPAIGPVHQRRLLVVLGGEIEIGFD